ncbi:MAG TPA: ATP phosphoribosyltransferase regulatory subunit [Dehalococcoidia bacterium]|nr:ATP phosphoribosyltransferase regulatory subunit [Dehalococcoidia bacterium]
MTSQRCKGARDLLPEDTERFRHVEDTFRSSCLSWGYQEVRTPTLEYLHLFTAAGTLTPNMLSKVYSFLDWDGWSGERVVLRPDGTIPVARLYIENLTQQEIAKLFYVNNVFAFEETGKENRERWQCGVELLGSANPTSDVEIILLAAEILHSLGISNIKIQLSHAGMLKALLKELKLNPDEEASLLTQVLDGNWQVLAGIESANSDANRLLSLLLDLRGKSSGFLENLKALPQISLDLKSELDNFAEVTSLLDALDCNYQIDVTSTRGFEYYTGLCFQFSVKENKIGSGGRYNDLIPLIGGKNTPACGLALYINPLMNLVQPKAGQKTEQRILIRGETTMLDIIKSCFQLAQSLREAGYVAELDFNSRQLNWRWLVTVQEEPSPFIVIDQTRNQKGHAASVGEVINIIGGSA